MPTIAIAFTHQKGATSSSTNALRASSRPLTSILYSSRHSLLQLGTSTPYAAIGMPEMV